MARRRRARDRRTGGGARSERRSPGGEALRAAAAVLLAFGVYAGTLDAAFTYDDHFVVGREVDRAEAGELDLRRRIVRQLTYHLDFALFGDAPRGYHLHSVLWHALCTGLLYALARRVRLPPGASLAAAALFAVHPIHVEAVANVANRKESLALAFSLASLLAYLRFLDSPRRRARDLLPVLAFGALAVGGKETVASLPLVAAAGELCLLPKERRFLARRPALLAGAAAGGAAAAVLLAHAWIDFSELAGIETLQGYAGEPSWGRFALTAGPAFGRYAGLLAWPAELCPDHLVPLATSLLEPRTALGWLGLAGTGALAVGLRRRAPRVAFGLAGFLLLFAPVSNLVPMLYVVAERYMYAPSAFLALAVAAAGSGLVQAVPETRRVGARRAAAALALVAVAALGARTVAYAEVWDRDARLWSYVLECNPRSHRAHNALGVEAYLRGDAEEALERFDRAVTLGPERGRLYYNRGNALVEVGRPEAGLRDYERALRLGADLPEVHYNRGVAYLRLQRYERAEAAYGRALELEPDYLEAQLGRARVRIEAGRLDAAEADLERALALDPESASAHYLRATLLRQRGDTEAARAAYARAARLGLPAARRALEAMDGGDS